MSARGLTPAELAAVYRRLAPAQVIISDPPERMSRERLLRAIRHRINGDGEHLPAAPVVHHLLGDLSIGCGAAGREHCSSVISEVNCSECHQVDRARFARSAAALGAGALLAEVIGRGGGA